MKFKKKQRITEGFYFTTVNEASDTKSREIVSMPTPVAKEQR
ncbi:hypothetical protein Rcae01_04670 [Novipirellula caenicola]|uniref:Uncharacterized protein n=1 Tax=Novipirellula caenicola TaxID=1536901 RepID=A0ABP9VVL0_9BACT